MSGQESYRGYTLRQGRDGWSVWLDGSTRPEATGFENPAEAREAVDAIYASNREKIFGTPESGGSDGAA